MTYKVNLVIVLCIFGTPLSLNIFGFPDGVQITIKASLWLITFVVLVFSTIRQNLILKITRFIPTYYFLFVLFISSIYSLVVYGILVSSVLIVFTIYTAVIYRQDYVRGENVLLNSVLLSFTLLSIINFIFAIFGAGYFFSEGYQRLIGVVGQSSQASQIAAVTLILIIFSNWNVFLKIIISSVSLYVIAEAGGRTIVLALIISLMCWVFVDVKKMKIIAISFMATGIIFPYLAIIFSDVIQIVAMELGWVARTGDVIELYTLSGRVPLWEALIEFLSEHWVFGVGYGNSKDILPTLYKTKWGWDTDSAHNAYLHVFLEAGIFGFIALIYFLSSLIRNATSSDQISLILFLSILSIMSSVYAGPGVSILMFLLIARSHYSKSYKSVQNG